MPVERGRCTDRPGGAALPWRSRLRFGLAIHLHLHSLLQRKHSGRISVSRSATGLRGRKLGLVESLQSTVRGLRSKHRRGRVGVVLRRRIPTRQCEFEHKAVTVKAYIEQSGAATVWDLGANTGYFSLLACGLGLRVVAFESTRHASIGLISRPRTKGETRLMPLVQDLANPTPSFGWENQERASIFERGRPELVLALALIHHLVLAGNQPLENVGSFF